VDYEGELAIVIGRHGRNIKRSDAKGHIWGYTIINDVTARDRQKDHRQWYLGKALDTFCPMGPWITTSDEVDAENLQLQTWVNGELRQDANTRDLIFDIPGLTEVACELIADYLVPQVIIRSPRVRPAEFVLVDAKRLLQHYPPQAAVPYQSLLQSFAQTFALHAGTPLVRPTRKSMKRRTFTARCWVGG
jgi:hypothetical protein